MERRIVLKCKCDQYVDMQTPCCESLKKAINNCNYHLFYSAQFRDFGTINLGSGSHLSYYYCPFCGQEFKQSLKKEWNAILEKEYGLNDPTRKDQQKLVPVEFQTDEWWKKRGL